MKVVEGSDEQQEVGPWWEKEQLAAQLLLQSQHSCIPYPRSRMPCHLKVYFVKVGFIPMGPTGIDSETLDKYNHSGDSALLLIGKS